MTVVRGPDPTSELAAPAQSARPFGRRDSFTDTPGPGLTGAYATVEDVQAIDVARVIGQGQNPKATQVELYLELTAAEIDSALRSKGYALPVSPSAVNDLQYLRRMNAEGAFAMMEKASPSKPNVDKVQKAWSDSLQMLRDAEDILETPMDSGATMPRGPGVTEPPRSINPEQTRPFFTRDMHF